MVRRRNWVRKGIVVVIPAIVYLAWVCYRVPLYFGVGNWWTIARAESVELYRIDPFRQDRDFSLERMAVAGPLKPDDEWTRKVVRHIGDSRNYGWDIQKMCLMMPGVALRFKRGQRSVEVLFCFECSMLSIGEPGSRAGSEDFDPMRPQLVEFMKKALPRDPVIQSLTNHHYSKERFNRR